MTSTFWPMSLTAATCTFPEVLIKASSAFERFYLSRHSGRRLTWQPSMGNADVRVTFNARNHDLNVSTFALVILLLFEDIRDDQSLTYEVSPVPLIIPIYFAHTLLMPHILNRIHGTDRLYSDTR